MKETISGSAQWDMNSSESTDDPATVKKLIRLLIVYISSKMNSQRLLYLSSFLTFGIGDGVTAVFMMDSTNVQHEANPLVRYVYVNSGKLGVVIFKIWYTLMIFFLVWGISRKTNTYWTINGFLFALTLGGIMAIRANMMAALGMVSPAPEYVISIYLFMVLLFMMIGDLLDKLNM